MWVKLCIILNLILQITLTTSEDCCHCSDDSNFNWMSDKSGSMRDDREDVDDCPCRHRNSDSVGSSSILVPNTVSPLRSIIRQGDLKEEPKPLLHPEVGFASSILETIREVTDEEYKEALARDAARNLVKAEVPTFTDPIPEESGRITVVVNPRETFKSEEHTSHVQEARCIHPPLGSARFNKLDHLKLIPKHPKVMKEFAGLQKAPKKLFHKSKNIFDMDVGASNLQERLVDGVTDGLETLKLKTNPSLFSLFPERTFHRLKSTQRKTENGQRKKVLENECAVTENKGNGRSLDNNEGNKEIFGSRLLPKLGLINQFHKSSEDEDVASKPLLLKNLWKLRDVEIIPPRRNNTRKNKIIPDLKARPLFLDNINERQNIFDNFKPIKIGDLFLNPTHQDLINSEGKDNANNKDNICESNNEDKSLNSNDQPSLNHNFETEILDTLPAASENVEVSVQKDFQDVIPSASKSLPSSSLFRENLKNYTSEPENYFEKTENSEENVEESDTKVVSSTPDLLSKIENTNNRILDFDPKDNSDVNEEASESIPLSSLFRKKFKNGTPEPENYFEKTENSEENVEKSDTKVVSSTPDLLSKIENTNNRILDFDPKDNSDVHEEASESIPLSSLFRKKIKNGTSEPENYLKKTENSEENVEESDTKIVSSTPDLLSKIENTNNRILDYDPKDNSDVHEEASESIPLSSLFRKKNKNDTPEPENYFEKTENSEENVEESDTKVVNSTPDLLSMVENTNNGILDFDPKDNSDVHEESSHYLNKNKDENENENTLMLKNESPDQILSDTSSKVRTNEFINEENSNSTMEEMKRIQFCSSVLRNFEDKEKINGESDEKLTDKENMFIEMKHQNESDIEGYSSLENDDINLSTEKNSSSSDSLEEEQFMNVNEEFIESKTLLPLGITKEDNQNSITYEDLQNMSDSLLKLENKNFEDISKSSLENTTTIIVSDMDTEQTTTQNIISLPSEVIPISLNEIKSNDTVTDSSILDDLEIININKTRSAEDANEMSVSASNAVASLIRPLGRLGSNLQQNPIFEPLSIMGGSDSRLFNNPLIDGLNLPKIPTLDDITSSISNPGLMPDLSDILGSNGRQPIFENLKSRISNTLQGTDVMKSSWSDNENLGRKSVMSLDTSKSNPFDAWLPKNTKTKNVSSPLRSKGASNVNVNNEVLKYPSRAGSPFFSFSDTENTVRNIQETLKSTLEPRSNILKLGNPLDVPSILETVSKTHNSFNNELQMFHNDFNDRLSAIHKSILDQSRSHQNDYVSKRKLLGTQKSGKENRNPISSTNKKSILRNTPTNLDSPLCLEERKNNLNSPSTILPKFNMATTKPLILQSANENPILNQLGLRRHIKKEGVKVTPLINRLKSVPKVPLIEKKIKISFSTTKRPVTTPVPKLGVPPFSRSNNRNNKHKLMPIYDSTGSLTQLEGFRVPFSKRSNESKELDSKPKVNGPEDVSEESFISKSSIKIDRPFSQFGQAPTFTSSRRQISAPAKTRSMNFARYSELDSESVEIGTGPKPSLIKTTAKPIDMEIGTKPRPPLTKFSPKLTSNNPDQSKQKSATTDPMFANKAKSAYAHSKFLSAEPREGNFARKVQEGKNVELNSRTPLIKLIETSTKPTKLRPEDTSALRTEKEDKTFNVSPLRHTIAWPRPTDNSFLSKVREAMKARMSNLNKSLKDSASSQTALYKENIQEGIGSRMKTSLAIDSEESVRSENNQGTPETVLESKVWPKFVRPLIKSNSRLEDHAATDSAEEPVVERSDRSESIKETVSYKCKMLCTKE